MKARRIKVLVGALVCLLAGVQAYSGEGPAGGPAATDTNLQEPQQMPAGPPTIQQGNFNSFKRGTEVESEADARRIMTQNLGKLAELAGPRNLISGEVEQIANGRWAIVLNVRQLSKAPAGKVPDKIDGVPIEIRERGMATN